MPRDSDKNNDSRGRRDRPGGGKSRAAEASPVAKAAPGRRGGRRRSSPSAGLPARVKATASGVPMPGSPTARNHSARSLIPVIESLMPANATAMTVRRAGTLATHRVRAATGHLPAVRHAVTMVKSVRSSRAKIVAVATSARSSRAVTVRISIATTVRRAASATMRVRRGVLPTGSLATGSPIPRAKAAARSGPTRRVAKGFAKTATVRVAIGPSAPGRRAMAIVPVVIGLRENLAVTRSSRAVRPIEARARILVIVPIVVEIAAIRSRGRSVRIAASAMPVPPAKVRAISTSRALTDPATTAAARSVRASRVRARIARNSTVLARDRQAAPTGRSIRAVKRVTIGRAARTRTTARFLQNAPPSAAVAPIASASLNSTSARRSRRASRNPASASPRWFPAPVSPRAAMPRNGSRRAASPSTAA